jgi:hypothetical protein
MRRLLSEQKVDQEDGNNGDDDEPRDHYHLNPEMADGRNVILHSWVSIKKAVAITEGVRAANQINDEEDRRRDAKGGKGCRIDQCHHHVELVYCPNSF